MKAMMFTGPESLVLREIEKPQCGNAGILVRVEACGICGSDIRNYHTGLRGDVTEQIMGHEIAGVVEEVGDSVKSFSVGDHVAIAPDVSCGKCFYCHRGLVNLCTDHRMIGTHWPGGFAQYVYLNEVVLARGMVHHMPEELGFSEATIAEPAASVLAAQANANITLGDTVVVIGDGPIGCLHLEIARVRGSSRVIMVGLHRLALASQFDPDHIIDAADQDPVKEVLKLTDGLGADVIIVANSVAETQQQAVEMARKRGKIILFGGLPKNQPMTELNSNLIHYNELRVMGTFSYPAIMHQMALELIAKGKIQADKYITETIPLESIAQGISWAMAGKALKIVISPWA